MGFKVTVHKNGAKHGEAHYTSEAVAVGMAKKMKNAGADVSVARCNGACCCGTKANPRRARGGTTAALEQKIAALEATLPKATVRAALNECGWSGPMMMASRSEMETYLRELRRHAKANPRHRRNGTTSANMAAARAQHHLFRNGAKVDAYVPAYLSVPRHGGNVILAQHPSDAMPMMIGVGNAPTAFQRKQYAGCTFTVVPASSVKRHRIGG